MRDKIVVLIIFVFQAAAFYGFFAIPASREISINFLDNWINPKLEEFMIEKKINGRIYFDGVRIYYIRKSLSVKNNIFYDLNPRVNKAEDANGYQLVRRCFSPNYWVVARLNRTNVEFKKIRKLFDDEVYYDENEGIFVARKLKYSDGDITKNDCESLVMKP